MKQVLGVRLFGLLFTFVVSLAAHSAETRAFGLAGVDLPRQGWVDPHPALLLIGQDYDKIGLSVSPGESLTLRFKNTSKLPAESPVFWKLCTYTNEQIAQGSEKISVDPGEIGEVPIPLSAAMKDGPYWVYYCFRAEDLANARGYYFDYRKPQPSKEFNLTVLALLENMDAEGWVRGMLGGFSRYANVLCDWPEDPQQVDAVILIGEGFKAHDPRIQKLKQYVQDGGNVLVFAKPPASLSDMLPVETENEPLRREAPVRLQPGVEGPWDKWNAQGGPEHYPVHVQSKDGATVLAQWSNQKPAVVQGKFGKGNVIYIAAAPHQVWQDSVSFKGADELALRLLYWLKKGDAAVGRMLAQASEDHERVMKEKRQLRDWAFENQSVPAPEEFSVVSQDNAGRFGWLLEDGYLCENITYDGRVMNFADERTSFTLTADGASKPQPGNVKATWLSKAIDWNYSNGQTVRSTLSLGSPGALWEVTAREVTLNGWKATHAAYMAQDGMKVVAAGDKIAPEDMQENWLITFVGNREKRDVPHLIVFTRRPENIELSSEGLSFSFDQTGFKAFFTASLWGMRRLAPGETMAWADAVPEAAIQTARRWSRAFLQFPVENVQIGWVEDGNVVNLADRFRYRSFETDWKTEALQLAPLPPIVGLVKSIEAPVEEPADAQDLGYATKYGWLKAVEGDSTHMRLRLPSMDHRAVMLVDERMEVQPIVNRRAEAGFPFDSLIAPFGISNQATDPYEDLLHYSNKSLPYNLRAEIDLYKWWYVFNGLLGRPFYSETVREKVDRYANRQYWETLNFYPHKTIERSKREPYSGVEYMIAVLWLSQTRFGYRNFNDSNENSGIVPYSFANYARYYGDWPTVAANWNLCRRQYEYLPRIDDWAAQCSGALEFYRVMGFDMLNSEYIGHLAMAYSAKNTGNRDEEIDALVRAARSLCPSTARMALKQYLAEITAEGDVLRDFKEFLYFNEYSFQASPERPTGGIGILDTSKGMAHELALAYKEWAPKATRDRQVMMTSRAGVARVGTASAPATQPAAASRGGAPSEGDFARGVSNDVVQRMILGWDWAPIWEVAKSAGVGTGRKALQELYNIAITASGDIPVFLSDWAPAEYVTGHYNMHSQSLDTTFICHNEQPAAVRIYSQRMPEKISVNGQEVPSGKDTWRYEKNTGWLDITLAGVGEKQVKIVFGEPVAPLHPYFTKIK